MRRATWASTLTILREITLPLLMPGIISAGLFAFLLSWGNFPLSLFTTGADSTLPEWLYAKMVSGYSPLGTHGRHPVYRHFDLHADLGRHHLLGDARGASCAATGRNLKKPNREEISC